MSQILVVDDEKSMRDFLKIALTEEGYQVETAESGNRAIELLEASTPDLIITDMKMPGKTGLDVLRKAKEVNPLLPVIMITAYSSTDDAVEAMKLGATDYITKPFKLEEIKLVIKGAVEKDKLIKENVYLKEALYERYNFSNIIGGSEPMLKVFEIIKHVADSKSTVLITGASGTGKELVAKAIHFNSSRREKPFLTVNCAALPEQLLESELFGHEKGAFTGAVSTKKGLMEVADGGTFFLDEVGEMPPVVQVKLLRVLQEREFKRVGGIKDITVDVRIIAASDQDLKRAVEEKRFRESLYYRLNVVPIELPTLSERKGDIPLLVQHFLRKYGEREQKNPKGITREAMRLLENYSWPGNVRELENIIEHAVAVSREDVITEQFLPEEIRVGQPLGTPSVGIADLDEGIDLEKTLEDIEKIYLLQALNKTGGVKKKAADLLNLSFRSLRYRLKKLDLADKQPPGEQDL
jgi:two-component system response regulator PilR (NtrC family)